MKISTWDKAKEVSRLSNGDTDWITVVDIYYTLGGIERVIYSYIDKERPFRIVSKVNSELVLVHYTKSDTIGVEYIKDVQKAPKLFKTVPDRELVEFDLPKSIMMEIDDNAHYLNTFKNTNGKIKI